MKIAYQGHHQIQPKELVFHHLSQHNAQHGLVVRLMVPVDQMCALVNDTAYGNMAKIREDVPIIALNTLFPSMEEPANRDIVTLPALSAMMENVILAKLELLSLSTEDHAMLLDVQIIPEDNRTVNAIQIPVLNINKMLESIVDMIALVDKFFKANVKTAQILLNVVLIQILDTVMHEFHAKLFNAHTIILSTLQDNVNHAVNASKLTILEDIAQKSLVEELETFCLLTLPLVDTNNVLANNAHHTKSQQLLKMHAYQLRVLKINTLILLEIANHAKDIH